MGLKIVYPICCGIDVHKTFVVACVASTNNKGVTTYKRHRFSTFTKGLRELSQWLCENDCKRCLYGIYREILDSRVQCLRGFLQHHTCTP